MTLTPSILGAGVIPPVLILILCLVAGIGTVFLLPSRKEASLRKIGGVVLLAAGLIFVAFLVRASAQVEGMGVYFWAFSTIALVGASRVVTHPKPVYSALYFILTVFATAGLFVLLWAEFMAAALVLIYAGAILVTYVFVIMLASDSGSHGAGALGGLAEHDAVSREPVIAAAVGYSMMGMLLFAIFEKAEPIIHSPAVPKGTVEQLGRYLFRNQLVNLELSGLILTIAMVGAIVIARRRVYVAGNTLGSPEVVVSPATPVDDNPHSIPVVGTTNPRQKAFPET